jgi:hypothetical protein
VASAVPARESIRSSATRGTRIRVPILIVGNSPDFAASYPWFRPILSSLAASWIVVDKHFLWIVRNAK